MNAPQQARLPIGTRVTHFGGGPNTHGFGTIVAYNGIEPSSYLQTNFKDAVELAGEAGLLSGLVNSFYDHTRCPYVVRWDVNPARSDKYPRGYKDVYELDSVFPLEPMENIFDRHGKIGETFTVLVRHWHDTLGWTQWEPLLPDMYKQFEHDPSLEFCIRPLPVRTREIPPSSAKENGSPWSLRNVSDCIPQPFQMLAPTHEIVVQPLATLEQLQALDRVLEKIGGKGETPIVVRYKTKCDITTSWIPCDEAFQEKRKDDPAFEFKRPDDCSAS